MVFATTPDTTTTGVAVGGQKIHNGAARPAAEPVLGGGHVKPHDSRVTITILFVLESDSESESSPPPRMDTMALGAIAPEHEV